MSVLEQEPKQTEIKHSADQQQDKKHSADQQTEIKLSTDRQQDKKHSADQQAEIKHSTDQQPEAKKFNVKQSAQQKPEAKQDAKQDAQQQLDSKQDAKQSAQQKPDAKQAPIWKANALIGPAHETREMLGHAWKNPGLLADNASVGSNSREPATLEQRFEVLVNMTNAYFSPEDKKQLQKAFKFASEAHLGQHRKSGESFIAHPVEVAIILADLRLDVDTISAALLHDVVEDTNHTCEELAELFNPEVAELVDGVTKITQIEVESLTDEQAATMRKMFIAMSRDIRVVVIKLADRLHNMRTLNALREDRRIFKARETLEIYAPIANRLGISSIKWELEDLGFYYLEPNKYRQIERMVAESLAAREAYLQKVIDVLTEEMDRIGIRCQIAGRPKHLRSIYQKMIRNGKGFSEIYDLIAVRIITETEKDCYSALGAVHTLWHPMPGRFKDYIAMPKNNMYQSLHTTVIGPAARPLEVQIRTQAMHATSEFGVAAHWRYKETGSSKSPTIARTKMGQRLNWLREMVDWQDTTEDSREFLKNLKMDLENEEVYVFTPKGEVCNLRAGSTPIDFAYHIHTEVGNHCVGAKVNGLIVPLGYTLRMGDRVEILTQKGATPSRDWISRVKTPTARSKIRAFFSRASRSDDLQVGYDRLNQEVKKNGFGISNAQANKNLGDIAQLMGYKSTEDMLVAIGKGAESEIQVSNRLVKRMVDQGRKDESPSSGVEKYTTGKLPKMITNVKRPLKQYDRHSNRGVVVKGVDNALVRLGKCCRPVPGDEIVGFITRGRGVSVHCAACPNAKDLMKQKERVIEVQWDRDSELNSVYSYELRIGAKDRLNLLRDITVTLSDLGLNMLSCNTQSHKDGTFEMSVLFELSDRSKVETIISALMRIEGVFDVHRSMPGGGEKTQ